jgi:UDP-glucose 4-epimerase
MTFRKSKILITGGNGYIAQNLTRLFQSTDHTITSPSKSELNLLECDDIKYFINETSPDVIIHTAIRGGDRIDKDGYNIAWENIYMYDNLMSHVPDTTKVIVFGSGAEFDRRSDIDCEKEENLTLRNPVDLYGKSKNTISRKILNSNRDIYLLRLFGCFNYDEEPFRFIKQCITNIKTDNPIEIHQNKMMDFFYMDDVFTVIQYLLNNSAPRHMNLVYNDKYSLLNIANMILDIMNISKYPIIIEDPNMGLSYTGDGNKLNSLNLSMVGLYEGIKKTIKVLK